MLTNIWANSVAQQKKKKGGGGNSPRKLFFYCIEKCSVTNTSVVNSFKVRGEIFIF